MELQPYAHQMQTSPSPQSSSYPPPVQTLSNLSIHSVTKPFRTDRPLYATQPVFNLSIQSQRASGERALTLTQFLNPENHKPKVHRRKNFYNSYARKTRWTTIASWRMGVICTALSHRPAPSNLRFPYSHTIACMPMELCG